MPTHHLAACLHIFASTVRGMLPPLLRPRQNAFCTLAPPRGHTISVRSDPYLEIWIYIKDFLLEDEQYLAPLCPRCENDRDHDVLP